MKTATRLILGTTALLLLALLLTVWLAVRELTGQSLLDDLSGAKDAGAIRWHLWMILLRVGAPLFAATLALYLWARHLMAPMARLARAAQQMSADRLHERLPNSGRGDEFDELTKVFNAMAARLERSFEQVRDFTLNASHELKTPLAIMRSDVEEMLDTAGFSETQHQMLESHLDEIDRLGRLVDALSFLTKADAQLINIEHSPVALDDLVREAVEDAEALGAARNVTASLGECVPTSVIGDRHRLRQVLLILCDNAVKYNLRDGTGKVWIALKCQGKEAHVCVSNTGQVLSPEELAYVFERFYRGAAEQSRSIEGSGLGLSIARWIIEQHRGRIVCESAVGETTFTVILPMIED
jgi:signal transduction histidine kinase